MRLTEIEMQKRRKTIILAAFQLFCEKGIENVTMAEIAKAAGVGEATIYRYFENKTFLVLQAFVRLWDAIMSKIEESVKNTEAYSMMNGYQQVEQWIDAFQILYQDNSDFILFSYETKLYLLRHEITLDTDHQDTLMSSVRTPCIAAIEKGKKDGSIPVQQDSEDIFYAVWGAIRGYIVKVVIYDKLFGEDSPWESRYSVMKQGILCALSNGWKNAASHSGPENTQTAND